MLYISIKPLRGLMLRLRRNDNTSSSRAARELLRNRDGLRPSCYATESPSANGCAVLRLVNKRAMHDKYMIHEYLYQCTMRCMSVVVSLCVYNILENTFDQPHKGIF
jgi:hypothetical protein